MDDPLATHFVRSTHQSLKGRRSSLRRTTLHSTRNEGARMHRPIHACSIVGQLALTGCVLVLACAPACALTDADGDGVDDAVDNCATLYNPAQDGGLRHKL